MASLSLAAVALAPDSSARCTCQMHLYVAERNSTSKAQPRQVAVRQGDSTLGAGSALGLFANSIETRPTVFARICARVACGGFILRPYRRIILDFCFAFILQLEDSRSLVEVIKKASKSLLYRCEACCWIVS